MTLALVQRLGLGCARLRGGLEYRASCRLVEAALDAGLRYFDTAPSYGLGDSERILGDVLATLGPAPDVHVATKVGFEPPPRRPVRAAVRAFARGAAQALLPAPARARLRQGPSSRAATAQEARRHGQFAPAAVQNSVARSLERLRRARLHTLLLHEPGPEDPAPDLRAWLQAQQAQGRIARLGVGTGGGEDGLPAFGTVRQYAARGRLASGGPACERIEHGLLRGAALDRLGPAVVRRADPELQQAWQQACEHDPSGAVFWVALCLQARPDAMALVSSTSPARLRTLVRGLERLPPAFLGALAAPCWEPLAREVLP